MNLKLKKMKKLITFRNSIALMLLLTTSLFYGQNKYVETFDASKDMVVTVNTSHVNVIFKTWNKNKVEVEAFIDDESLSIEEKQKYFEAWNFNVLGNSKSVVITSNSFEHGGDMNFDYNFDEMEFNMEFLGPLLESIDIPEMPDFDIPEMPELSNIIMESVGNINFDYEAFKEDEEGYMKEFEKQMEEKFGPEFEEKMEAWGENFEKEWEEKHGPEWEAKMEAWGEEYEKDMEVWAEEFEKDAEKWEEKAEEMAEKMEKEYSEKYEVYEKSRKVNKTIIIKMPKNTKTDVNVRHGELKMADAYNMKATLNYSPFTANSIDGGSTLINAAYAPVIVNNWEEGSLYVSYVEECSIKNVNKINLQAISSDILLDLIENSVNLSGSIGVLKINKIAETFSNLDITLENSEAIITLPKTDFSFIMDGDYSSLKNPKSISLNKNNTLSKYINITALYSNVTVQ